MTYYTTSKKIREHDQCPDSCEKLLRTIGKTSAYDEPISLVTILDSNGLDYALWSLSLFDGINKDARLFAVWCARQVQHLMTDQRSLTALDVAEQFANGNATDYQLSAAFTAAYCVLVDATRKTTSWEAEWATRAATRVAHRAAERAASGAACYAASAAAYYSASAAERNDARISALKAQENEFRRRFCIRSAIAKAEGKE